MKCVTKDNVMTMTIQKVVDISYVNDFPWNMDRTHF